MKNQWSNRLSFIITTAAFSIGLGNIWRFPYIVGEGGGGAFLLVYLILLFIVGLPMMIIEIGLGRMSSSTTLVGFGKISKQPIWNGLGWLGVLTAQIIMCYYVMILAWVAVYFIDNLTGNISGLGTEDLESHFILIAANSKKLVIFIFGIMTIAFLIIRQGLQSGLERYSKYMIFTFILLLLGLAIWASTLQGAGLGYKWYLMPDFSKINLEVILSALGQLFFSIGVGMAIAFTFGSYTNNRENLITSTGWIVFMDTFIAVLAGLLIFPAIFSFGLSPESGPNLIFITMTSIFSRLYYGEFLGVMFFLLLFLAGFTSLLSNLQVLANSFQDKYKLSFFNALFFVSVFIAFASIPVVYSFSDSPLLLFGMTIFDLLDFVTNKIMLPLSGLLIAIFGAYVIGFKKLKAHLELGAENINIGNYWKYIIQWVIPISILIIFINGIN